MTWFEKLPSVGACSSNSIATAVSECTAAHIHARTRSAAHSFSFSFFFLSLEALSF